VDAPPDLNLPRLRSGVDASRAAAAVDALVLALDNVRGSGSGPGEHPQLGYRDAYIRLVEDAERAQRQLWSGDAWLGALQTGRYWQIRNIDATTPRAAALINDEIDHQLSRLGPLVEELVEAIQAEASEQDRDAAAPGATRAVFDTLSLLQYQQPQDIDWPSLLDCRDVRLVLLLIVVEELDGQKNGRERGVKPRAADVLRNIDLLMGGSTGPIPIRDHVYLETWVEPDSHVRRDNHDDEILAQAQYLSTRPGGPVVVLTGDRSMRIRAQARGSTCLQLPDDLRRPIRDEVEQENRRLKEELGKLKDARPKILVSFEGRSNHAQLPAAPAKRLREVLDERGFDVVGRFVEGAVSQAANEVSEMGPQSSSGMARMLEVSEATRLEYNESRRRWLTEVRVWAEDDERRARIRRCASPLALVITNSGSATAEDVEVAIALDPLQSRGRLTAAETFASTDRPEPPQRPSMLVGVSGSLSEAYSNLPHRVVPDSWLVSENGTSASIRLRQVRHGGAATPLASGVFLTSVDSERLASGTSLAWTVTGVTPALEQTGTLQLAPPLTDDVQHG